MGTEGPGDPDGRYTSGVFRVVVGAEAAALRAHARFIGTEHLLIGLTTTGTTSSEILLALAPGLELFNADVALAPNPTGDLDLSPRARAVVQRARQEASALRHGFVGSGHLLLALVHDRDSPGGERLRRLGIDDVVLLGAVATAYEAGASEPRPIEIEIDLRDGELPGAVRPPDTATGALPQGQ